MLAELLNAIQLIDTDLFMQVYRRHHPLLDQIMPVITNLGTGGLIWLVWCALLFFFGKAQGKQVAVITLVALVFSYLLCQEWIKALVARPRPFVGLEDIIILVPPEQSYSFPSGHTATSFACAYVIAKLWPTQKWLPVVIALAIGFSRIYVGVHYPTDVLFGALFGIICGEVVIRTANIIKTKRITLAK